MPYEIPDRDAAAAPKRLPHEAADLGSSSRTMNGAVRTLCHMARSANSAYR
ncbi:MAG: hypothetical protein WBQ45_21235 [Roseiarcus sp.]